MFPVCYVQNKTGIFSPEFMNPVGWHRSKFSEALKVCGIYVEGPAMDDLISWLYKQEEVTGRRDCGV